MYRLFNDFLSGFPGMDTQDGFLDAFAGCIPGTASPSQSHQGDRQREGKQQQAAGQRSKNTNLPPKAAHLLCKNIGVLSKEAANLRVSCTHEAKTWPCKIFK